MVRAGVAGDLLLIVPVTVPLLRPAASPPADITPREHHQIAERILGTCPGRIGRSARTVAAQRKSRLREASVDLGFATVAGKERDHRANHPGSHPVGH